MKIDVGDCVFYSGTGFISRVIRVISRGKFSHVGIISKDDPLVVTEALAKGLVHHSLYGDVSGYKGQVWVAKLSDSTRSVFDEQAFNDWICRHIGTPYGWVSAAEVGLHDILHKYHPRVANNYFCSEAAVLALQAACVIEGGVNAAEIAPNDLWEFSIFGDKFRIK